MAIANILLTVTLTVILVVVADDGARGYVLGNYGASTVILIGLWILQRDRVSFRPPRRTVALLRFGGPTVPADAAAFALNVVDRTYLLHAQSADAAGRYGFAAKLSTVVIVAVRGFQAAWPPLAYSVTDEAQAARLYARVTTAYVAVTGHRRLRRDAGRPLGRSRAGERPELLRRVGRAAVGGAGLGALRVGAGVDHRRGPREGHDPQLPGDRSPAWWSTWSCLVTLVGPLGIAGAGIALCGAYVVIVAVLHLLTRRLFVVPFEWGRLASAVAVLAVVGVGGELLLPTHGAAGLLSRLALLAIAPALLIAARVVSIPELRALRNLRSAR